MPSVEEARSADDAEEASILPSSEEALPGDEGVSRKDHRRWVLLVSVFVISVCCLVYELLAGTLASYLEGESVYQFSMVIGLFMSSMGVGSYLSRYVEEDLVGRFVAIELAVGVVGGASACLLFFAYAFTGSYRAVAVLHMVSLGILIGLEIPLVTRILRRYTVLRTTLADVFSFDYVGALVAALAFPILFVPYLGLMQTSFFFGLLNVAVGSAVLFCMRDLVARPRALFALALGAAGLLACGLIFANHLSGLVEANLYRDPILYARQTSKQKIVLTRWKNDLRMYIDGNIQFSSSDEYRYHESLIHPAAALAPRRDQVLVLGGGDGLALREILKYDDVKRIDLVDFDPAMVELCRTLPHIVALNGGSLDDPRVHVHTEDAYKYLERTERSYDLIYVDLPDPNNLSLGRLYTRSFYTLCAHQLNRTGILAMQSTSPFFAPKAFWCIHATLASSPRSDMASERFKVLPYHVFVPSFGDWGFQMASRIRLDSARIHLQVPTRFLDDEVARSLFHFGKDRGPRTLPINTLNDQVLVGFYETGWKEWN